jgi:hypothetical protein
MAKPPSEAPALTDARRIAASECLTYMALVAESKLPHAAELAEIIVRRVDMILHGEKEPRALPDADLMRWAKQIRRISRARRPRLQ